MFLLIEYYMEQDSKLYARSSVIFLLPLFTIAMPNVTAGGIFFPRGHCNLVALLKYL